MKKFFPITLLILLSTLGYASLNKRSGLLPHKIKVAVIDTGLNIYDPRFRDHLCPVAHTNFVWEETLDDTNGHGSHITGLIQKFAGNANYCLLIYKYYSDKASGQQNLDREVQALRMAVSDGAEIINFSGGGPEKYEPEFDVIRNHPQITFVVAAGNDHQNLDLPENTFYPASYWLKNEQVVENISSDNERSETTNYSNTRNTYREVGVRVRSYLPNGKEGKMSGTSQACAIHTGKLVDKLSKSVQ